jgi:hypothetical protein
MIDAPRFLLLLAERNTFRDMGGGFRDKRDNFDPTDLLIWLGIVAGVLIVMAVVAHIVARRDKGELFNSPWSLFRALCHAHGLKRFERRLLRQIARYQRLGQPAQVFLEPECYNPVNLSPGLRSQQTAIDRLRDQIFSHDPPEELALAPQLEASLAMLLGQPTLPAAEPTGAAPTNGAPLLSLPTGTYTAPSAPV